MTEDERDDVMAELAAGYVAALHAGDDAVLQEIVGHWWDGTTGAPAAWVAYLLRLLEAVGHMVSSTAVDWAAVEDAMTGRFPITALNPIGRYEVIRRLARKGMTDQDIADRIGMTKAAVCKFRNRYDIHPGVPQCNRITA